MQVVLALPMLSKQLLDRGGVEEVFFLQAEEFAGALPGYELAVKSETFIGNFLTTSVFVLVLLLLLHSRLIYVPY